MNNPLLHQWKEWFAGAEDKDVSPAILKQAVEQAGWKIAIHIPERFFTEELALFIVDRRDGGCSLRDIPRKFRTKAVCLAALKYNHLKQAVDFEDGRRVFYIDRQEDTTAIERIKANQDERFKHREHSGWYSIVPPESQSPEFAFQALLYDVDSASILAPDVWTDDLCYMAMIYDHSSYGGCNLLKSLPREKLTRELCYAAVSKSSLNLEHVPPEFITREMCYSAVSNIGRHLDDEYSPPLKFVPARFKDYELCLMAVRACPASLEFVPEVHKTEELCRNAFEFIEMPFNGHADKNPLYVPEKYLNEDFCLFMTRRNKTCFEYIPEQFKTKKICLAALGTIGNDISILEKMPPHILADEDFCITAINCSSDARYFLKVLPSEYRTLAVCMAAVEQDGAALSNVPKKFQGNEELLEMAYKKSKKPRK